MFPAKLKVESKTVGEFLKNQGRMVLSILAVLGAASMASASPSHPLLPNWKASEIRTLPSLTVELGREVVNPTYRMKLPDGTTIILPTQKPVSMKGLTKEDAARAAEDTRFILEKVSQILVMRGSYAEVLVQSDRAWVAGVDSSWAQANKLQNFDPIAQAFEEKPMGANAADVLSAGEAKAVDAAAKSGGAKIPSKTAAQRVVGVFQFLRDAIWTSTIEAYRSQRTANRDIKAQVQEWGIQLVFRGEIQFGMGSVNVTRNFPLLLSIGFNRAKRTIVFRRGIRSEKMAGGTALSLGGKFEVRFYRLIADAAYAADPRAGYAGVRGQSWYPPSIPVLSAVVDSAPGYHSVGFSFGLNVADFVPGAYLLNTVTSFQEEQRVYSAEIPEPAEWLRKFHKQVSESAAIFTGHSRGARCEALFRPSYASF